MHESILVYRRLRYLKWSLALTGVCAAAYVLHRPLGPPNGGTWLGYTLGVVAAGVMVWLAWLGIKKRHYGAGRMSLQEWLSAHVYFGMALALIAALHAGFRFGINIHTLLYVLMMIAILSGMVGVYFYVRYPAMLAENRRGVSSEVMLAQLAELDRELRQLAMHLDDETTAVVLKATQETVVAGSLVRRLRGYDPDCPTTRARQFVEEGAGGAAAVHDSSRRQLLTRLVRKEDLVKRVRRDVQLRSFLKLWLYVHVPFSVAALTALVAHVTVEFYYL